MIRINSLQGFENVLDIYYVDKSGIVYSEAIKKPLSVSDNGHGYKTVSLKMTNIRKWKKAYVHRIVALAFVEGYQSGLQVNHKDENKSNNAFWNLEWVTSKYNNNYGTKNRRCSESKSIKCLVYDYNLNFCGEFTSIKEAEDKFKVDFKRINSRTKEYFIVDNFGKIPQIKSRYTSIVLKDLDGNTIKIFKTNQEARRFFNGTVNISDAVRKKWTIMGKYKVEVLNYQMLIDSLNLQEMNCKKQKIKSFCDNK